MEDILGYLLIGGFIAFTVLAEIRKKAKENASKEVMHHDSPAPTSPQSMQTSTHRQINRPETARNNFISINETKSAIYEGERSTHEIHKSQMKDMSKNAPISDYHISSAEEVRRAIIWSEILRRKY